MQVAGPAAPLAFAIGTVVVLVVGLSFIAWTRRVAHAGSAYGYITQAFGKGWGFMAGWALLLAYATFAAGTSVLVGNFIVAAARTSGFLGPDGIPGKALAISVVGLSLATLLASRNMRIAGRTMLLLEGISLLAVVGLSGVIVTKVHGLTLRPFMPSPANHGWAGVGYGLVFAVLSFGGFEAAATLGEETDEPHRNIPLAMLGTLLLAGALYVFVAYAQVVGFGIENAVALANDPAPLDTLALKFASRGYAVTLDLAAALGGFSCVLGSLSAAGRMLYAVGRAGLIAEGEAGSLTGSMHGAVLLNGLFSLACLLLWARQATPGDFYGALGTIGTLALILVYMGVALAEAKQAALEKRGFGIALGVAGMLLLVWPLFNSVYPVPAYPGNMWPYLVLAWFVCGGVLLRVRPRLMREPVAEIL